MKQFAFLITVLLMVFSLFGCKSSNTETEKSIIKSRENKNGFLLLIFLSFRRKEA